MNPGYSIMLEESVKKGEEGENQRLKKALNFLILSKITSHNKI
ncbi:hypothetical protein HDEF_2020 [Candidatus Hamiltonella defensa 5AT (Acyrthosiphon pisum)]|uniref:Uncharacterized protein n=1 Tax=Hamiltonella defensa subsp. Acyrthosiphon pisum (strain 5AT) TaxID=572265 RepID=C4K7Q5_HAMD5|nr:hypothetical protein HDEF_2020 [Candidatus Hamiltonella defensa 5AT (Acyrthosiphon pisum)]